MRKIGVPITIRVDTQTLAKAQSIAALREIPLRSLLRHVIESYFVKRWK